MKAAPALSRHDPDGARPALPIAGATGRPMLGKRLGLLHDLVPTATVIALLVNPAGPNAETNVAETEAAARKVGLKIVTSASNEAGIDAAFAAISQTGAAALLVGADVYFNSRRDQIVTLASRAAIPTLYEERAFAAAGGLASYGTNLGEVYYQQGVYVGRILKGEKPADLPIVQPTKFELIINLKTPRHWVSTCRRRCLPPPTRSSSDRASRGSSPCSAARQHGRSRRARNHRRCVR